MDKLNQDIHYTLRVMRRNPGFTATVLITLALGIGANSAIFSVVSAVLLRPLPFGSSDRVMFIWETNQPQNQPQTFVSLPDVADFKSQNQSFEHLASYTWNPFTITGDHSPEQVRGLMTSEGFFRVLGSEPALGRSFRPDEEREPVVILSNNLWRRLYNGDPGIIGQGITMNGDSYTVVGVMPPNFWFPSTEYDLWTTFGIVYKAGPGVVENRKNRLFRLIGRLKPGVNYEQAQSDIRHIARNLEAAYPNTNTGVGVNLVTLAEQFLGNVRPALLILLYAVGFVLLIACANVANLLLSRMTAREKEMAVRTALGGGRWRLVRQLLTESLIFAILGGALGLALAVWGVNILVSLSTGRIPRLQEAGLDTGLVIFTFVISLLTGIIFGLAPALQSSKSNLTNSLKAGGRGSSTGVRGRRLQAMLVVVEIALSLVLLVGAGLLVRSFMQVLRIDPGFNPDNLLTFQVEVLDKKYANVQQRLAFFDRALERFRQLPGVNFVGMCESRPPDFLQTHREFMVEGQVTEGAGQNPTAHLLPINSDFFSAMGVKLISGRAFTDADRDGAPKVVIINQHLADRVMPDENPIGKRIRPGGKDSKEEWHTVVGVVGDVDYTGVDDDPGYQVYFSYLQHPTSGTFFMIRTAGDPANLIGAARREIASIDSERPIARIKTGQELISDAIAEPRFNTFLLSIFASVALILAITGIYGVISYSVSQRTHEIGIRMALGAKRGDIIRQVLWSAARLVLIGVGLGLGAAFALTRTMQTLLFDVAVTDKTTYIVAAVILTLVAVLACLIPARRASRVDPMIALRYE